MGKHFARLALLGAAGALALAPAAGAYTAPGTHPGQPGGPQTKPTGGNHASKSAAKKVGNRLAGFTGAELATKGQVAVTVHFPKAGTIKCSITGFSPVSNTAGTKIGSGKVKSKHKGDKNLVVIFNSGGIAFLNEHTSQGERLEVSCTFKPKHGHKHTSHTTVLTDVK